jgi:hypothetical protein
VVTPLIVNHNNANNIITTKLKAIIDEIIDVDYDAIATIFHTTASAVRSALADHCYFKTDEAENDGNDGRDGNGDVDPHDDNIVTNEAVGLEKAVDDELRIRNMTVALVLDATTDVETSFTTTNMITPQPQPPATEVAAQSTTSEVTGTSGSVEAVTTNEAVITLTSA